MTMSEIAARYNTMFAHYGLTHDVVVVETDSERLMLVGNADPDAMTILADTLQHLIACHSASPRTKEESQGQLRLF